ncbi:MAG TPA: M48 family metalloprotease, partial [Trichocoleus sp.]
MAESSGQPPASSPSSGATPKELLQRGSQAVQQQDYAGAIAAFEALRHPQVPASYQVKAQIGLIRVYTRLGDGAAAATLCRPLTNHPNPQVKSWAQSTLSTLTRNSTPATAEPPVASPSTVSADSAGAPRQSDRSGFMPLAPASSEAPSPQTPSAPVSYKLQPGIPAATPSQPTASPADQSGERLSTQFGKSSIQDELAQGEPTVTASLFHYQRLNQSGHLPLRSADIDPAPLSPAVSTSVETSPPDNLAANDGEPLPPHPLPFQAPAPLPPLKLWIALGTTAVSLFWLIYWLVGFTQGLIEALSLRLYRLTPALRPVNFDSHYSVAIGVGLVALLLASPWVMDFLLRYLYRQKVLLPRQLKIDAPDTVRTLRQMCQQKGWPLPELRLLPDQAPLCFSYGWWPSNMRIVVSQGLLEQFEDAELASLYAYEMGHLQHWEMPLMSGLGTLLFLVHQGYWQSAQWGDRQRIALLRALAGLLASLCYGLFWLLRKAGLWLSRLRSQYCDRTAVTLTQNPTVHAQCLLKLTHSLASHIEQKGYTSPLLESLDLLTPLSQQIALSPGSCLTPSNLTAITAWDRQNPYRRWLLWNLPHPLLGERLLVLERSGAGLGLLSAADAKAGIRISGGTQGRSYLPVLLAQGTPVVGLLIGLALAMLLWFLGGVMEAFDGWLLSWLYQDVSVLKGITLLGLGIGLMLPINRLYPEIRQS